MRAAFRILASCAATLAAVGLTIEPAAAQSVLRDAETEALLHDMATPLIAAAGLDPRNVDVVLVAYGFDPVPIFVAGNSDKIEVNKWGGVIVDENQMTSVPGVFAGGDLVRGPDLVVRAVRDSRKAAAGIHRHLSLQTRV